VHEDRPVVADPGVVERHGEHVDAGSARPTHVLHVVGPRDHGDRLEPGDGAGDLGGFFLLKGEGEHLMRVRASDEMERHMIRADLVVEGLGAVGGALGDGVTRQMAKWLEAARELS